MKLTKKVLTAGVVSALSFSVALIAQQQEPQSAQQSAQSRTEALESSASRAEAQAQQRMQQEFGARQSQSESREKASELKGSKVKSQSGEELGSIEDVAVNLQTGELAYLLVGAEGDSFRPIPVQAATVEKSGDELALTIDIEKDRWESAPTVEEQEIAQLGSEQQGRQIYQFFGENYEQHQQQQMQYGSPARERQSQSQSQQSQQSPQSQQSQQSPQSEQSSQSQSPQAGQSQSSQSSQSSPSSASERSQSSSQQSSSSSASQEFGARSSQSSSQSGQTRLGSELMDAEIENQQQQKIGEVEDMILNLEEGRVDLVLFKGEETDGTFAVSPDALQASSDKKLRLNVSEQDLQQAQALNEQQIDRHLQQARASGSSQQSPQVYRWEGEESSSTIFGTPSPDRDSSRERDSSSRESSSRSQSSQSRGMSPQSDSSSDR